MLSSKKLPTAKTIISTTASIAASAMLIRTVTNDLLPYEVRDYIYSKLDYFTRHFWSEVTVVIEEFQGLSRNEIFEAADSYLGTKLNPSVNRFRVSKDEKDKKLAITVYKDEEVIDDFENAQLKWRLICHRVEPSSNSRNDQNLSLSFDERSFELSFHKKHKEMVLEFYLPYILERSKAIKAAKKAIQLHTVEYRNWDSNTLPLDHPMTFENLAMDSKTKESLLNDLEKFKNSKDYYRKIGKAWKRGYLLYGPPGTGKSSLIVAMANHLNYDIYDLDLTELNCNSDLRALLLRLPNKTILVIEDIDCSIKLKNRDASDDESSDDEYKQPQVTLSGLLNFIDGIWSCCGEERVTIFTTNYKEKLDPALLRPGRMDMHVHMSYCTFSSFQQLSFNYLGVREHELFGEIKCVFDEVEVSPAEVAGELMKDSDVETSLRGLLVFLNFKKNEQEKAKVEKKKIEEKKQCEKSEKKGDEIKTKE